MAKKEARAHIRKTGNLNVNGPATSNKQEAAHKQTEKRLHDKIEAMKSDRNRKNNSKEKQ